MFKALRASVTLSSPFRLVTAFANKAVEFRLDQPFKCFPWKVTCLQSNWRKVLCKVGSDSFEDFVIDKTNIIFSRIGSVTREFSSSFEFLQAFTSRAVVGSFWSRSTCTSLSGWMPFSRRLRKLFWYHIFLILPGLSKMLRNKFSNCCSVRPPYSSCKQKISLKTSDVNFLIQYGSYEQKNLQICIQTCRCRLALMQKSTLSMGH